jgi:hypothetical protein
MSRKPNQSDEFERIARELGCDEDEARFNEKLKRIAREGGKKPEAEKPKRQSAPSSRKERRGE